MLVCLFIWTAVLRSFFSVCLWTNLLYNHLLFLFTNVDKFVIPWLLQYKIIKLKQPLYYYSYGHLTFEFYTIVSTIYNVHIKT